MRNTKRPTSIQASFTRYSVYGLTIESELFLPELKPIGTHPEPSNAKVDITIEIGNVENFIPGHEPSVAWAESWGNQCLLRIEQVGRYLIEDGQRIIVQVDNAAAPEDVRLFLLGSALAAAMHQRRLVPLHVSAVLSPQGVIAFTGESGAGKSTMAAHLNQSLNWPLISDDVAVLHEANEGCLLESGVNTVKLWVDALHSLNRTSHGLRRDMTRYDKFHAVEPNKFVTGKHPLKKLIFLDWSDQLEIRSLSGRRAFQAALGAIHRPELARMCGNRDTVVKAAMNLASSIDILLLNRRRGVSVSKGVPSSIELALFDSLQ